MAEAVIAPRMKENIAVPLMMPGAWALLLVLST
jgi:hypothetical protein